jgi:hypothetical protein
MKAAQSPQAATPDAFTFVEVFASLVFLAILIPAIVEGLSVANRASVVAERSAIAGELAENEMNELILSSTGTQTSTDTKGDFGTDWPGYHWQMTQAAWNQDTVNVVTEMNLEVFYPVQGAERTFTLTTLISGTAQNQGGL